MPLAKSRLEQLQILKLLQTVRSEDLEKLDKLIVNGIPNLINYSDAIDGEAPIHLAACSNNVDILKHLIDLEANPNVEDIKGRTASMRAAEYGHLQALELLCQSTADMTVKDKEGHNVLFYCLHPTQRHMDCLTLAIKFGANVNCVGIDGKPLVCKVAKEGLVDHMQILLEAGANPNSMNEKSGENPIHIAASRGFFGMIRGLLDAGGDVNALDNMNRHASHKAALYDQLDVLRVLSGYGAEMGKVSNDGNTPMHWAAARGLAPICKYLGQRGCPATLKNKNGKIPRLLAKEGDFKDAFKECKKAEKPKGTRPGTEPWTIKLYDWMVENEGKFMKVMDQYDPDIDGNRKGKIATNDFISTLKALEAPIEDPMLTKLTNQHDPNRSGVMDYNLFLTGKKFVNKHFMVNGGKGKTKIVMPICISPEIPRGKKGAPPADYIEKFVHFTDNTRFDKDHPPEHPIQDDSPWYIPYPDKTYVCITEATKSSDFETLKAAFARGTDVNQLDKYYKTPLMTASLEGNVEVVKFLIENGANVNAEDNFKWTPLHFACHSGQLDVVEYLLEKGAELDRQACNGGTPVMRAIESSREAVVQFLINKGAKIQVENKKGQTALDIAYAFADPRVISIVERRWKELPPPVDKRKKGGKGAKRTKTVKPAEEKSSTPPVRKSASDVVLPVVDNTTKGKSSILRAASAIGMAHDYEEPIVFTPQRAWVPQQTTTDLMIVKEMRRTRYGYEIDFPDYKPHFQKHIEKTAAAMDAEDN